MKHIFPFVVACVLVSESRGQDVKCDIAYADPADPLQVLDV